MHGNNLSGKLPYNLRLCQKLRIIDVGGNKLTGEIPTWIGQMYQMQFLNLRGNKLHGSIPPEICNLTNIQVLDLSINNLSSIIPDCFNNFIVLASKESGYKTNLKFLKLIDFSSNRLTGNIPKSFSNMRASMYAGNDGLCGDPLPKCPEDSLRPSTTNLVDNMNEKNFIFMQEVDISMIFGFIIGFWGVVGSFLLKKSWRDALFNWLDVAREWFCVKVVVLVSKFRQS
ncbi:uracil phosphoribosyltransferase [Salvia divinorum]|uniref:Uracil phosphoribosyltransferase n=1 Tax=Salvia divinorum TaxID=28513 RepID=A0ABD1FX80_SALDI